MNEILPIFKSHYSIGKSILTLRNSESTPDEADSIFDICTENKLKEVEADIRLLEGRQTTLTSDELINQKLTELTPRFC